MAFTTKLDMNLVVVTLGGFPLSEFAEGDCITVEQTEDDVVAVQGTHGSVALAKRPNNLADMVVRTMGGSPVNLTMQILYDLGRSFPVFIKDGGGTELVTCFQAVFKKLPQWKKGTEQGAVEWPFLLTNPVIKFGLNFPA